MKQFINKAALVFLLAVVGFQFAFAQEVTNTGKRDENSLVYWFKVGISYKTDQVTGMPINNTSVQTKKVYYGNLEKFDLNLWKGLSTGSSLSIGPFFTYDEAYKGMALYNTKHETAPMDTSYNASQQVHYFNIFVGKRDRSNSLYVTRKPGAVASGTYESFYDFLKVSLSSGSETKYHNAGIAIGPFWDYNDANFAVEQYRKH